jgi:uncharacterized Fe-S cluster-containing radical SAM superfamily protein
MKKITIKNTNGDQVTASAQTKGKEDNPSNMYANAKSWNPFKGCGFDCAYCGPTFKKQAKRQKRLCDKCYRFEPHEHPDRLDKIPSSEIVFVCGNADIAFCETGYLTRIVEAIKARKGRIETTYYLQSKRPECLEPVLKLLPKNVVLVTTLETNRDEGYSKISKAPVPSVRYEQFRKLDYKRKVVTIEPVMDFDVDVFASWIINIKPEYVWLGYNSHSKKVPLPEPSPEKLKAFAEVLLANGIQVRGKHLRGIEMPASVNRTQD